MENKFYSLLAFFILSGSFLYGQQFGGGSGTEADPYLLKSTEHMMQLHEFDWNNSVVNTPFFRLENDIDMQGIAWKPVNQADPYSRHLHFDGNKKVIKNLSSKDEAYASLFGVLCGSCKNLGLVNVDIVSKNGGGAFGGYLGLVSPSSSKYTGTLDNCFSTGRVEGFSAVGGLVGNLGKSKDGSIPAIRNCYSACEVVATYEAPSLQAGGARVGGLVGTAWNQVGGDMGVLENCYATGTVKASLTIGAGGLVGYSDIGIKNCIAWNDSIINNIVSGSPNGKIGYGAAYAHPANVQSKCLNVWASEKTVLQIAGTDVLRSSFLNPSYSLLGTEKNSSELTLFEINAELQWDFMSDDNIWSQDPVNGYPVLQWMSERSDVEEISGHKDILLSENSLQYDYRVKMTSCEGVLKVSAEEEIQRVELFDVNGSLIRQEMPHANEFSYNTGLKNRIVIVRLFFAVGMYVNKIIL